MDSGGRIRATAPSGGGDSLPSGVVLGWFLSEVAPTGFVICNGANGTDDLRGRFLRGTPLGGTTGSTGGSDAHSHTAGAHTHSVTLDHGHTHTLQMPAHNHGISICLDVTMQGVGCGSGISVVCCVVVPEGACTCDCGPLDLSGSIEGFCGSVDTGSGGDVVTSETTTLPPYEDVLWIMKV